MLRTNLIPAINRQNPPKDLEHDLFALPARHDGLGIGIPSKNADRELQSFQKVTLLLKDHLLDQDREYSCNIINKQLKNKTNVSKYNKRRYQEEVDNVY